MYSIMSIENYLDNVKINSYDYFMNREKYHHGNLKLTLIESGLTILKEGGISALSLRSAARKAGVSHSAPYAHFSDKAALLAAISTQGFTSLYNKLTEVATVYQDSPAELLVETGWEYAQFALTEPSLFKLMFSGILEGEPSFSEFEAIVQKTYLKLVEIVGRCQSGGVLRDGPANETAIAVWSLVHGFIVLYIERQFPAELVTKKMLKSMLVKTMNHFMLINLDLELS